MRTNIVIDDKLMAEALKLTNLKTKKEVVEEALRTLIGMAKRRELARILPTIGWEGDLEKMRQGRTFEEPSVKYYTKSDPKKKAKKTLKKKK